jgi:endogenous inhibitor of DNA gyrase (YacG/DUF329 family)
MTTGGSSSPRDARGRCPNCSAPTVDAYRPFCSRRCADVDLGRWLTGGYAIAGRDDDDDPARTTDAPVWQESEPKDER